MIAARAASADDRHLGSKVAKVPGEGHRSGRHGSLFFERGKKKKKKKGVTIKSQ